MGQNEYLLNFIGTVGHKNEKIDHIGKNNRSVYLHREIKTDISKKKKNEVYDEIQ